MLLRRTKSKDERSKADLVDLPTAAAHALSTLPAVMPRLYDGRMHANRLGAPCVGCGAAVSKKWVGAGPYACTSRACQRALAARSHDDGEHGVGALDDLADLGDALPAADDPGEAAGDAAAAGPPSVDAPVLADAAAQTDDVDVDGLVDEQLHDTIADLHAIVAEKDERIERLEATLHATEERVLADMARRRSPSCRRRRRASPRCASSSPTSRRSRQRRAVAPRSERAMRVSG